MGLILGWAFVCWLCYVCIVWYETYGMVKLFQHTEPLRSPAYLRRKWLAYEEYHKLSGNDWCTLLSSYPGYANRCDWKKLDIGAWGVLLKNQPRFIEYLDLSTVRDDEWPFLLSMCPGLADQCDAWHTFSEVEWSYLLTVCPQFESVRTSIHRRLYV